jgi:hypothetical protein
MTRDQRPGKHSSSISKTGRLTQPSYKFGIIICGVGALICKSKDQLIAQDALLAGAFCCSTAAAAVTASQSVGWVAAANKLGAGCRIGKDHLVKGGKLVGQCVGSVCKVAYAKVKGKPTGGSHVRDVSELAEIQDRVGNLIARYAEMEAETEEDTHLVARDAALLAVREPAKWNDKDMESR